MRLSLLLTLLTELAPACAAPGQRKLVRKGLPTQVALDKPEKVDAARSAQLLAATSSVLAPDAQGRVVPARGRKWQQPRGSQAAKGNGARAPPFHAKAQLMKPKAFHANADALLAWHAAHPTPPEQCKWSQTEVLLKANVQNAEDEPLASGWVLAWLWNMECFPRLHVIYDVQPTASLARIYGRVPNQTSHLLRYPFAARGHPRFSMQMDVFWRIQWPMLWADNFTTAPFVMVLDSDSPLTMPLRCHHIFDQELPSLPVWHSWQWPKPPQWSISADAIVRNMAGPGAKLPFPKGLDFMTFFPVTQHVETAILIALFCRTGSWVWPMIIRDIQHPGHHTARPPRRDSCVSRRRLQKRRPRRASGGARTHEATEGSF